MIMLIHLLLSPLLLLAVSSRKNNVLMIVVDDLRYDMEPMRFHQPNMDALASRGVHFTRAFAQYALCSPSRSSLLTGLRPGTTMVRDLTTHFRTHVPDAITLPQQFRKHGYRTLGAGKIFHRGLQDNASWTLDFWINKRVLPDVRPRGVLSYPLVLLGNWSDNPFARPRAGRGKHHAIAVM